MANRFHFELWDNKSYLPQKKLDLVSETRVHQEENGAYRLEFSYPINDENYAWIEERKVVRLIDSSIPTVQTTVSATTASTKRVVIVGTSAITDLYNIGDFVLVYDNPPNNFSTATTSAISSGSSVTVNVSSTTGLSNGEYVRIGDNSNSETVEISSVTATTFIADIGNDYVSGASVTQPARTFVAKVLMVDGNDLYLSRFDFTPATNAVIKKVNFVTFRVSDILDDKNSGIPLSRITCEHILFDLNNTTFFKDSRTDISYASKGTSQIIQDKVDIDTFLDNVLARHLDADSEPINNLSFIKGDVYRHRFKRGRCSTNGTTTITGDSLAEWNSSDDDVFFGAGSIIAIDGETSRFTITHKTGSTVIVSSAVSNTDSDLKYLIISSGVHKQDDKIGTCTVTNGSSIVDTFSFTITDGNIGHGARFRVEGDDKEYIVDYVTNTTVVLTENIERSNGSSLNCVIKKDEREISIDTSTSLLGALTEAVRVFTDDRQLYYIEVDEDRSINLVRKPLPDGRDPTSSLVVKYQKSNVKNLKTISREKDIESFANRIIALGASSGWVNATSGVEVEISQDTDNTKDEYQLVANDAAKLRFGDPIQVYQNPFEFDIDDATQITVTRNVPSQYNKIDDGSVFTSFGDDGSGTALDETTSFTLLPGIPAINDAQYFGASKEFNKIIIKYTNIGSGTWTIVKEYYDGATWSTLTTKKDQNGNFVNDGDTGDPIGNSYGETDGYYETVFDPPSDWTTTTVDGISAYWVRFRVSAYTSITTQPTALRAVNGGGWTPNEFAGGLIQILSGEGNGQTRRIVSNTSSVLTISRKWDKLPIDSTAIVAKNIGNTFVRGFGYKKLKVTSVPTSMDADKFETDSYVPGDYMYFGGMCTVIEGTGLGQSFVIINNELQSGSTVRWTVDGTFNPELDTSSVVEVTALPQMVWEQRASTTFVDGGAGNRYVQFTPDKTMVAGMWSAAGTLYITSGSQSGDSYSVSNTTISGSDVRIHVSSWGTMPSNGDSVLVVRTTDLPVGVATGLEFSPNGGDKAILLLKESGGNLTVGKTAEKRSTVTEATRSTIIVQSGEGSNFEKNQTIFIGAKSITSNIFFDLNRGNQIQGQEATISSISSDTLTVNEDLNPVPQPGDHVEVIGIVDNEQIIKNDIIEEPFQIGTSDPIKLLAEAEQYLERIKSIEPRYKVSFLHFNEYDPEAYPFDSFKLGDTVNVVDDDLDISVNKRIVDVSFDPLLPGDLSNTIQLGRKVRSFSRDRLTSAVQKLNVLSNTVSKLQKQYNAPVCVWWSDEHKKCLRLSPPNIYCDSNESNNDGRLTREGGQITKLHCQAFRPDIRRNRPQSETGRVSMETWSKNSVSNDNFSDTVTVPLAVDFRVNRKSSAAVISVHVSGFPASSLVDAGDYAEAVLWTNPATEEVIPFDDEYGTGCYLLVRRLTGSNTLDLYGVALLIGHDD